MFSFNFTVDAPESSAKDVPTSGGGATTAADATPAAKSVDIPVDGAEPPPLRITITEAEASLAATSAPTILHPIPSHPGVAYSKILWDDIDDITSARGRDVVAGVYEGGAKTWECTDDLIRLLLDDRKALETGDGAGVSPVGALTGLRVLDLGCGVGLLGIAALQGGAREVWFQDLNEPVLRRITAPNIHLNLPGASPLSRSLFIAGSWSSLLHDLVRGGGGDTLRHGIDVILSSETLYTPTAYPIILSLLDSLLPPSPGRGLAVFSTKRYYFGAGLGGGTSPFLGFVEQDRRFSGRVISSAEDGKSMTRDILLLQRK